MGSQNRYSLQLTHSADFDVDVAGTSFFLKKDEFSNNVSNKKEEPLHVGLMHQISTATLSA
jgi:hypothetical protein